MPTPPLVPFRELTHRTSLLRVVRPSVVGERVVFHDKGMLGFTLPFLVAVPVAAVMLIVLGFVIGLWPVMDDRARLIGVSILAGHAAGMGLLGFWGFRRSRGWRRVALDFAGAKATVTCCDGRTIVEQTCNLDDVRLCRHEIGAVMPQGVGRIHALVLWTPESSMLIAGGRKRRAIDRYVECLPTWLACRVGEGETLLTDCWSAIPVRRNS
ncbi:MAG: hypothetical protein KIS87_11735 [Phycisphaeraceae bacterium]|nr:hypothetical protein [Phycisphaeraceae bacterium]